MSKDISDTIVTMILDKLISKICRDQIIKEINSNFNAHCNKFISKILSPYLNTSFIFHENGLDFPGSKSNKIFYNSVLTEKLNTWVSFKEPNSSLIDRYAFNRNKMSKNFDEKIGILRMKSIEKDIVIEQREFEKENNSKIKKEKIKTKLKDIWKQDNIKNKNIKTNILLSKNKIEIKKIKETKENDIVEEKKEKEKELILEIPGTFIPYEKNENINILINNTEENNLLRKERQLKIIEKEEMDKKAKDKKLQKKSSNNISNKKFNYDKLTFDSEGNVIKISLPQVNSFKKDFIIPTPKIKDKINILTLEKKDTFDKKKPLLASNKKPLKLFDTKLKIRDKNSNSSNNKNKEIKVEYNPEDKMDEFFVKSSKKIKNEPQIIYSGPNFAKISPEIGVIISDNDKNQSSGGKEKENNNRKVGGFEYIKKYNRPSMNEISNLLSNQKTKNNNKQISSFFNYDYSNNINEKKDEINNKYNSELNKMNNENNYIGYKEEFTDNSNPLFQGAVHLKDEIQKNKKYAKEIPNKILSLKIKNKKSFSNENIFLPKRKINSKLKKNISYQINLLYNKKNIHINSNSNLNNNNYLSSVNNILLSENFDGPNLKSIFLDEKVNHITTQQNKINKKKINNIQLNSVENDNGNIIAPLKNLKYRKNILPVITENNNKEKNIIKQKYINKFNFDIIKNKNWGNNINFENKNSYKVKFLLERNKLLKLDTDVEEMNSKELKKEKFKIRNKSNL